MNHTERFKAYVAAYLLLKNNGQILLLRRYNTGYQDGKYSLVAGHLDGGETTRQCIIREAKEEIGISIDAQDLEVLYIMHRRSAEREYFDIFLAAEKWKGNISNMEAHKCDELRWCAPDSLPNNIIAEVHHALEHISKGFHFGEFGWEGEDKEE